MMRNVRRAAFHLSGQGFWRQCAAVAALCLLERPILNTLQLRLLGRTRGSNRVRQPWPRNRDLKNDVQEGQGARRRQLVGQIARLPVSLQPVVSRAGGRPRLLREYSMPQ